MTAYIHGRARRRGWPEGSSNPKEINMVESLRPSRLAGKAFRFTWTAGPKSAVTHEYLFHVDGSVSHANIEPDRPPQYVTAKQYGAFELAPDIYLMSYLDVSGYALTVAMDFKRTRLHGFATKGAEWYPVQGRFEELSKQGGRDASNPTGR
jgi:hypothetical protein